MTGENLIFNLTVSLLTSRKSTSRDSTCQHSKLKINKKSQRHIKTWCSWWLLKKAPQKKAAKCGQAPCHRDPRCSRLLGRFRSISLIAEVVFAARLANIYSVWVSSAFVFTAFIFSTVSTKLCHWVILLNGFRDNTAVIITGTVMFYVIAQRRRQYFAVFVCVRIFLLNAPVAL